MTGRRRRVVARDYCHGCPVVALCAADAVENRDEGIIRAGVYIPERAQGSGYRAARRVLRYFAAGFVPMSSDPDE